MFFLLLTKICCNLCPQCFDTHDSLIEIRKKRHEEFHSPFSTSYKRNISLGCVKWYTSK